MKYLLFLLLSFSVGTVLAQQDGAQNETKASPYIQQLKKIGTDGSIKGGQKFKEEKNVNRQRVVLESVRNLNQQAKLLLKKAIDTNNLNDFLNNTKRSLEIVKDGIWINQGSSQTQRNLAVSSAILVELSARVTKQKQFLDNYADKLTAIKFRIDSLSNDPSIYAFPKDSATLIKFVKRMFVTAKEMAPLDTALQKATANLEELQLKTDLIAFDLRSAQEDIEIYSSRLSASTFKREFPNIWDKPTTSRPIH